MRKSLRLGSVQIPNTGGESLEKWAILYTSVKLDEAQLLRNSKTNDSDYNVFGDDDLK